MHNTKRLFDSIGIVYNTESPEACSLAFTLVETLNLGECLWVSPVHEMEKCLDEQKQADLVITVGGDGTILQAIRLTAYLNVPLLGINMGRLGFMTELKGDDALEHVWDYLCGKTWIEERAMLQAEICSASNHRTLPFHALNDVVVGRGTVSKLVTVRVSIGSAHLVTYRADAVMVSTATGSTGYNLSVGGPILYPKSREMVLNSVAPHVGLTSALVIPHADLIELTMESDQSVLSVDAYMNVPLELGSKVRVKSSSRIARFLRAQPPSYFYSSLTRRMSMGETRQASRALPS